MPLIKNTLEKVVGEEKFEKLKNTKTYKAGVEAFTMNSFSYIIAAPLELGIAGMDLSEHIQTRLAAAVTNTLTGRPYGIWRDWVLKKIGVNENSHWIKKYIGDTAAFAGFQLPLYWINMTIGGAEFDEIMKASTPITFMAGAMGGPYGIYLDRVRKSADLASEYLEEKPEVEE